MTDKKLAICIYIFCTAVYAVTAGQRLLHPSSDIHFVYQAKSWLEHRLDLGRTPPHANDWAEVEELTLRDGSHVFGQFLRQSPGHFRTLRGQVRSIADTDISERSRKYYVSFPPFPAVLLLPFVALFGEKTNDVVFTVLCAGLTPALLFLLLRQKARFSASTTSPSAGAADPAPLDVSTCLWLVALFAFGSVYYFCSVLGQVWFTAHIVSLALCAIYLLCTLPARRPFIAGLCLGALFLTRPQMVSIGLLFILELLREADSEGRYPLSLPRLRALPWRKIVGPLALLLLPCALFFAAGVAHNYLRFGRLTEFGHSYLTTMQADNIQRFGLVNYQYLPRNLAAALCLLPKLLPTAPYLQISYHGLALWFTTPALFYLLWPERESLSWRVSSLSLALVLCILPTAIAGLLYQNDGYIQFGFRFSLDFMLPLMLLLALVKPAAITTSMFRGLVIWGVGVNLFGAITFGRMWQFYYNGFFPVP